MKEREREREREREEKREELSLGSTHVETNGMRLRVRGWHRARAEREERRKRIDGG